MQTIFTYEIPDEQLTKFMKDKKHKIKISADVENVKLFDKKGNIIGTRVWHAGYMIIDGIFDKFYEWNNVDDFMDNLTKIGSLVFFHNAKYDTSFIQHWLNKNGYVFWSDRIAKLEKEKWIENGNGKKKFHPPVKRYEFNMNSMGVFYSLTIHRRIKKNGKQMNVQTEIWDSLKKVNSTVERMAKSYGLKIMKEVIDYDKPRQEGYIPTKEEVSYLRNDIEIVARVLWGQFSYGLYGMTNGQDALTEYKRTLYPYEKYLESSENLDKHNETREEMGIEKKEKGTYIERCEYEFRNYYPVVPTEINDYFQESYRGGFTWANPKFQGEVINKGRVYDVNSLYPSVMKYSLLPYSEPIDFVGEYEEDKEYPLYIIRVRFGFDLKENHIPVIQIKNSPYFKHNEYLTSSNGKIVDMHFTSVDWELVNEHYDLYEVEVMNGFKFKAKRGLFKDYIEHWENKKINATNPDERANAKIMLNTLYGKFGTNVRKRNKEPYFSEKGELKFKVTEEKIDKAIYTPMASFITSYARKVTISTAQRYYDRIAYCDTDSIHLVGLEPIDSNLVHNSEFGLWKSEGVFKRAKFIRQKTYVEEICEKFDVKKNKWVECEYHEMERIHLNKKCAGMPERVKEYVTFENFEIGLEIGSEYKIVNGEKVYIEMHPQFVKGKGKLKPKQVIGGLVLVEENFNLKPESLKEIEKLEKRRQTLLEQGKEKQAVKVKKRKSKIERTFRKGVRNRKKKYEDGGFEKLINKLIEVNGY